MSEIIQAKPVISYIFCCCWCRFVASNRRHIVSRNFNHELTRNQGLLSTKDANVPDNQQESG